MKRFILSFIAVVFVQMFCVANNVFNTDSTKIEYQVHGNDTLVIEKFNRLYACGLKQYINNSRVNYNNADYDVIHEEKNEYLKHNSLAIIQDVLAGYKKEQCKEMLKVLLNEGDNIVCYIRLRINLKGEITCVEFMYIPSLTPFMTYEDVKRNTEMIIKRKPEPFLVEYGIELSPWMTFSITSSILQRYLEKRVDFKYDEETVRFDVRLDTTVIAYIKEQYDDSVKLDGKIVSAEYDSVVKEYLQNEDVMVAVDSVQKIALRNFKRVSFVEGKDICIRLDINEAGEVVRCNFVFPSEYSDGVWPEHIYEITKKIKDIKFVSPGKYGCNGISIDIPINKLQYK
jgi:hypothetical protein